MGRRQKSWERREGDVAQAMDPYEETIPRFLFLFLFSPARRPMHRYAFCRQACHVILFLFLTDSLSFFHDDYHFYSFSFCLTLDPFVLHKATACLPPQRTAQSHHVALCSNMYHRSIPFPNPAQPLRLGSPFQPSRKLHVLTHPCGGSSGFFKYNYFFPFEKPGRKKHRRGSTATA